MTSNSQEIIQDVRAQVEQLVDFVTGESARTATADQRKWSDNKTNHWAWQPVKPVAIPDVSDPSWCQTHRPCAVPTH